MAPQILDFAHRLLQMRGVDASRHCYAADADGNKVELFEEGVKL